MSYFTRNMDKCSRLHSFPVTRYSIRPREYNHQMIARGKNIIYASSV